MASSEIAALLRRPRFRRYFTTVAGVRATGTMFNVAGVLLVLQRTHDLALAGVVVAAAALPATLSGPFLGGWLDVTENRRRLLVLDRVMTAASLTGFLLLAGHAPNWLLPLAAALDGLTSPLSEGGFASVLPEVAGEGLLGVANAFEGGLHQRGLHRRPGARGADRGHRKPGAGDRGPDRRGNPARGAGRAR